jgi:hypothetical protein
MLFLVVLPLLLSPSDPLQRWREKYNFGTRYEGPVTELVGIPNLELLSFSRSISLRKNINIHIRYFQPPGTRVIVVVRGTGEHEAYRMETIPTLSGRLWPVFEDWPSKNYLDSGIDATEIGVVGYIADGSRLPEGGSKHVVPLDVYPQGDTPPAVDRYRVVLKSNTSLNRLRATVEPGGKEINLKPAESRARIPFEFAIPHSDLPSNGVYRLKLEGRRYSPPYDPVLFDMTFSHPIS